MLRSMTGFGAASGASDGLALNVTVRAVNHRHLNVKTRLGADLIALEPEVEKRVRGRIERGAVTMHLDVARAAGVAPVQIDLEVARAYHEALADLATALGLEEAIGLDLLTRLPGVLAPAEAEPAGGVELGPRVLALLEEALDALVEMREREGAALERDLRTHLAGLRALAAQVAERMPEVVLAQREALQRRVAELAGAAVAPADLAREIAVLADRLDVSEELARLDSHFDQLEGILDQGGAVGRRLDFLCQELFREVNTIGSKCNDAQVAHWIVEAKTHAERLREQVQNVE